ncbi:MAG: hypothetical protein OXC46_09135 [Thaumarchaeota archaeon]|nr:hypothetical protein [Nitrososphaerota archaeon]
MIMRCDMGRQSSVPYYVDASCKASLGYESNPQMSAGFVLLDKQCWDMQTLATVRNAMQYLLPQDVQYMHVQRTYPKFTSFTRCFVC